MENIEIKELFQDDINDNILSFFNRYQEVNKCWINENGNWILINEKRIENWDKNIKDEKVQMFKEILENNIGYIYGAFVNEELIGFSLLLNEKFGSLDQYIQLKQLHISHEYRHKGIGKKLFKMCMEKAKEMGAKKIYISTNDSEESQKFYKTIGCKDAMEIDKKSVEKEPYDRQMEYEII